MALKLAPVATCDKNSESPELEVCRENPVIELSTGKILCLACACKEVALISDGSVPTAEFSAFDAEEAVAEQIAKLNGGGGIQGGQDITHCPECKKGPFKHLQAHRRKYHGKFVRGPRKDNPARSDMDELPNLHEEATRQLVDPEKVPPPPPEDF